MSCLDESIKNSAKSRPSWDWDHFSSKALPERLEPNKHNKYRQGAAQQHRKRTSAASNARRTADTAALAFNASWTA